MKKYLEMKDSKIEFLGKIPKSWEIIPLKYLVQNIKFAIVDGPFGTQLHSEDYVDKGIPLIRVNDIKKNGKFSDEELVYITEEKFNELSRSSVSPKDILLAKTGATIGKVCLVPESMKKGLIASSVAKISVDETKAYSSFVNYFLFSNVGQNQILFNGIGSTRPSINLEGIKNILICVPNELKTQKKIIEFLDKNIEKNNSNIIKKIKLIELLKEKQKSIMNYSTIIGFNKVVKMKNSEVEWIEKIPEHWEVTTLGRVIKVITYGITVRPEFFEEGIPLISSREIKNSKIDFENAPKISEESYLGISDKAKGNFGDLYFSKTGTIGLVARSLEHKPYVISQNIAKIVPNNELIRTEFLEDVLKSDYFFHKAYSTTKASTLKDLQLGDMKKIPIILPPIDEQKEISEKLDSKKSKINRIIKKTESQIKKIQEFNQSIIFSSVTGKIDVRETVA